jgi:hypothetical protein
MEACELFSGMQTCQLFEGFDPDECLTALECRNCTPFPADEGMLLCHALTGRP